MYFTALILFGHFTVNLLHAPSTGYNSKQRFFAHLCTLVSTVGFKIFSSNPTYIPENSYVALLVLTVRALDRTPSPGIGLSSSYR